MPTDIRPTLPAWVPPLDTGQPNAFDLNDLGTLPKANFAAANQIIPITYGRDRLFGQPFVVHVDDTLGHLYLGFSFCEGQIAGFEKILIGGKDVLAEGTAYVGLKNRGFESGDNYGWTEAQGQDGTVNLTVAQTGAYGINIPTLSGGRAHFSDRMPTPLEGTKVRVTGWAQRNTSPDGNSTLTIYETATVGGTLTATDTGNYADIGTGFTQANSATAGWQPFDFLWTVPAGVVEYSIRMGANAGTVGSWDFDDLSSEILADDQDDASADGIELIAYVGTQTQPYDSLLASSLTGYADALPGLAYIVARVPKDASRGFPRFEAIVQGRLVYDPRKDDSAGALGPELTFTRSGAAWFRDWEGLYREAVTDVPRFDGARQVENLLIQSVAPDGVTSPWTLTGTPIVTASAFANPFGDSTEGVFDIEDDDAAAFEAVTQILPITAGTFTRYTLSCYVRKTTNALRTILAFNSSLSGGTLVSNNPRCDTETGIINGTNTHSESVGDYWRFSWTLTNNGTNNTSLTWSLFPAAQLAPFTGDVVTAVGLTTFFGPQVENSTSQASDLPQEYLPTTTVPVVRVFNTDLNGLVLVGSRIVTNKQIRSEEFDNAAWGHTTSSTVANVGVAPDGTVSADRLVVTTDNDAHMTWDQHLGLVLNAAHTISMYVKDDGAGFCFLNYSSGTSNPEHFVSVAFDLANETVGSPDVGTSSGTFFDAGIELASLTIPGASSDWKRVWLAASVDRVSVFLAFGTNDSSAIGNPNTSGSPRYVGVLGEDVIMWGAQVEDVSLQVNRSAGDYVPTLASAVSQTFNVDRNGEPLPGGRGILRELASTNVAGGSNLVDTTATNWATDAQLSVSTALSVFPSEIAWQHDDAGGANNNRSQVQGTFSDGREDVMSMIIENIDATITDLGIRDVTAAAWVNLTTLTWATKTAAYNSAINGSFGVEDLGIGPNGGDLVRVWATGIGTAAGTGATGNTLGLLIYPSGAVANTLSTIIHHVQFETNKSFASSPIVTPGASDVTRNTESLTGPLTDEFAGDKGTLYARYINNPGATFGTIVELDDGTSSERWVLAAQGAGGALTAMVESGSTNPNVTIDDGFVENQEIIAVFAAANSDFQSYANGVAGTPDTSFTFPTGIDQITIGALPTGSQVAETYIAEVRHYNVRQSDPWLNDASLGNIYDGGANHDPSLTIGFNFARDMSLQGIGAAGGVGAHRVDDVTTWEFSQNPTLCFRDTIENFTGWGILDGGVVDNANANDELVDGVPRRQIGLTLARANTVEAWIKGYRAYMGAFLNWEAGKIRVIPNRPDVEAPGAIVFDNTASTWVDMGDQPELDFGLGSFTLEATFKAPTSSVTNKAIVSKILSETVLGAGYVIYMNTVGNIVGRLDDGTNFVTINSTPTQFDANTFHHVALVVDRTLDTMDLIIDDVVAATQVSIAAVALTTSNAQPFRVGALGNNGALFDGSVDEVRVWNDVRTPAELAANRGSEIENPKGDPSLVGYWKMNEATSATMAPDESASGNDGTLSGAAVFGFG